LVSEEKDFSDFRLKVRVMNRNDDHRAKTILIRSSLRRLAKIIYPICEASGYDGLYVPSRC
jgi:hypothetical protein